jgi:hypothetical protein
MSPASRPSLDITTIMALEEWSLLSTPHKNWKDCDNHSAQHASHDVILKRETLMKRSVSAKFFKNWRQRSIVLACEKGRWKVTWQKHQSTELLGELDLGPDACIIIDGNPSSTTFAIVSGGQELLLDCRSMQKKEEWLQCFDRALPHINVRMSAADLKLEVASS